MHHCNAIGTIKCFVKCIENILATARGLNISPFPRKTCKMKILCKGQSDHSKDNQTTILCYCTASYGDDYLNCSSRGSGFLAWMEYREPGRYRKPPRVLSSLKLKCSTNLVSPYGQHSEGQENFSYFLISHLAEEAGICPSVSLFVQSQFLHHICSALAPKTSNGTGELSRLKPEQPEDFQKMESKGQA